MNAVRKGIIILSSNLLLLLGVLGSISIGIRESGLIFMNGFPSDISESTVSMHIGKTQVAQGCQILKVPVAFN